MIRNRDRASLMMRKRWIVGGAVVLVLALASAGTILAQQGVTEVRDPPATRAEILRELPHVQAALDAGESATIVEQAPPDPEAVPLQHGAFRITPAGYVGTLNREIVAAPPRELGPVSADTALASASPLFREPGRMVAGFEFVAARSPFATIPLNVGVELVYRSDAGGEIRVRHEQIYQLPIDFSYNASSRVLSMSTVTLRDGREAIIFARWPVEEQIERGVNKASVIPPEIGTRQILMFSARTGVMTTIESSNTPGLSIQELIEIAESVK